MPQFCILFLHFAMAQCPPKYAPVGPPASSFTNAKAPKKKQTRIPSGTKKSVIYPKKRSKMRNLVPAIEVRTIFVTRNSFSGGGTPPKSLLIFSKYPT